MTAALGGCVTLQTCVQVRSDPGAWAGRRLLFLHTGGLLGMYDKADQLSPLVARTVTAERMVVS